MRPVLGRFDGFIRAYDGFIPVRSCNGDMIS